jgi:DNA-binding response OmpR family regulator
MSEGDSEYALRALVVDDEPEVADAYALRLQGFCAVETAYGGEEALSTVEESPVDVVLLDRHMPGLSGDDVLATLEEEGFDGRVVMVTAVDPGFDVLEMPFDDYLCKPVDREDVRTVVDQQRRILAYETLGEYFGAESKRAVLEAETTPERREDHEQYAAVAERAARLETRARRLLDDEEVLDRFDRVGREEH